jgi:PAS domain S-box-containing protein
MNLENKPDLQDSSVFKNLFLNSPIGVFVVQDGIFRFVNTEFQKISGYNEDELTGMESLKIIHYEDVALVRKNAVKMLKGEIERPYMYRVVDKNGDEKCLLAVTRDITHRKLAEQEKLHREKLQDVLEMAGATCHELGQPLQIAFALIDRLMETNTKNKNIQKLETQLYLMKQITENVRKITSYKTKDYISGQKIIDIEEASRKDE